MILSHSLHPQRERERDLETHTKTSITQLHRCPHSSVPETMEDLMSLLPMDNQFFSGGIGLAALGVGLSAARKSVQTLKILARRHLLVTLEVTSKDASYPWVLQWLNAHGRRTQHLSVNTSLEKALDGSTSLKFDLVPGPGRHFVSYNSRWFLVERVREHQSFAMASGEPWEKVLLTSYGQDYSCFSDLLDEAKSLNEQQEEGYT